MTARGRFESRRRARRRALQAIYQWQLTGQAADEILAQFRAAQDMTGVDDAYFETLLRGVISDHETLDAELKPFLDWTLGTSRDPYRDPPNAPSKNRLREMPIPDPPAGP